MNVNATETEYMENFLNELNECHEKRCLLLFKPKKNNFPKIKSKNETLLIRILYLYGIHIENSVFQRPFVWIGIDPIENTNRKFR